MNSTKASKAGALTWVAAGAILAIVAWLVMNTFVTGRADEQEYWPRDPTAQEQSAIAEVASESGLDRYTSQVYDDHPEGDMFVVTDARGNVVILSWDQLTQTRLERVGGGGPDYPIVVYSYQFANPAGSVGLPVSEPIPNAGTWLVYEDHMIEISVD